MLYRSSSIPAARTRPVASHDDLFAHVLGFGVGLCWLGKGFRVFRKYGVLADTPGCPHPQHGPTRGATLYAMKNSLWDEERRYRVRLYRNSADRSDLGLVMHRVCVTGETTLIQTESAHQQMKGSMRLKTTSYTLAPISLEWTIEASKGLVEILAERERSRVRAWARTDHGE